MRHEYKEQCAKDDYDSASGVSKSNFRTFGVHVFMPRACITRTLVYRYDGDWWMFDWICSLKSNSKLDQVWLPEQSQVSVS